MPTPPRRPETLPPAITQRLHLAREALLGMHKSLLDVERGRFEAARGPIEGSYHFLQLLIGDPWFAWLRPMSELIVAIDESLSPRQIVPPAEAELLIGRARRLLTPLEGEEGFAGRLYQVLATTPAIAERHAEAWRALTTG